MGSWVSPANGRARNVAMRELIWRSRPHCSSVVEPGTWREPTTKSAWSVSSGARSGQCLYVHVHGTVDAVFPRVAIARVAPARVAIARFALARVAFARVAWVAWVARVARVARVAWVVRVVGNDGLHYVQTEV